MKYGCATGCPSDDRTSRIIFRTCFGFTKNLTAYGQYVFKDAFAPDLFNLIDLRIAGVTTNTAPRPDFGLALEMWTMTPGHGGKAEEMNHQVVSALAYLPENLLAVIRKQDWSNRMLVLAFPCEPFPLPVKQSILHFEERKQLHWIPGVPEMIVLERGISVRSTAP